MINKINDKYNIDFDNAKSNYIKVVPTANQELIDSFPFKIQQIDNIKYHSLDDYNEFALSLLHTKYKEYKGLCGILSTLLLEASALVYRADYTFLTVGRILHKDKNIFNIPEKDNVLNKIIIDQNTFQKSLLGSNLHVWITLGNGIIIDPSILLTLNNTNKVIVGLANELNSTYTYEPYLVVDMKDISKIINNANDIPIDKLCKYWIQDNFNKMDIIPRSINGYY